MSNFASVAEAVAHYYRLGYATVWEHDTQRQRFMANGRDAVKITHRGLLDVVAEEYEADAASNVWRKVEAA